MIRRAAGLGVPFSWVTGDEVYSSASIRLWCEQTGIRYVLAVRSNFSVGASPPEASSGSPHPPLPGAFRRAAGSPLRRRRGKGPGNTAGGGFLSSHRSILPGAGGSWYASRSPTRTIGHSTWSTLRRERGQKRRFGSPAPDGRSSSASRRRKGRPGLRSTRCAHGEAGTGT